MQGGKSDDGLLHARALLTTALSSNPYSIHLYIERAEVCAKLCFPDLAASDAYRVLLLLDELDSGEYQEQVTQALQDHEIDVRHEGIGIFGSNGNKGDFVDTARRKAFILLTSTLVEIGDLRSAYGFAERGLQIYGTDLELQTISQNIVETGRQSFVTRADPASHPYDPRKDLSKSGSVRREIYTWNDHEPDRYTSRYVGELNSRLQEISPKCRVRVVDLPLLTGHKGRSTSVASVQQLGLFAEADISPGEVVLLEPSILAVTNRLHESMCDACSAPLPGLSNGAAMTCNSCESVFFCSQKCLDRALSVYHPAICGNDDFDSIVREPAPAAASESLYALLLARVLAMSETQDCHPLDLPEVKYLWGDFGDECSGTKRTLPFDFETNVLHPIHFLTMMDIDIFAKIDLYDTWIFNTLYAKFRGVASAKMNPQTLRPDVAAVHPMWSLANHSCAPNVRWEWGAEDENVRGQEKGAMGFMARTEADTVQWGLQDRTAGIRKGEEILNHYCDVGMKVQDRREWAVGALGGICMCERCLYEAKTQEDNNNQ